MPRQALHTDDIKIEQKSDINLDNPKDREGDIVHAEQLPSKGWAEDMAFNEEPISIRLEPSTEKNAAKHFPVWVNGKGAEQFINGQWIECAWIPVGVEVIVRRKSVAVLLGAKIDTIRTVHDEPGADFVNNRVSRFTSPIHSLSIIEDRNPKGHEWATELRRRNF